MELRMNPSEVLLKMVVVVESLRAQLTKLLKAGPHPVDPGTPIRPGACFVWHLGQPGLYFDFGLQEADHGDEVEKEEEEEAEAAEEAMEEEGQQEKAGPNQSFASYPASQEMDRDDEEGKQEEMKEEKQPARAAPNRLSEPFQEGDHDEEEEEE